MQTITTIAPDPEATYAHIVENDERVIVFRNLTRTPPTPYTSAGQHSATIEISSAEEAGRLVSAFLGNFSSVTTSPSWQIRTTTKGNIPVVPVVYFQDRTKMDWENYQKACRDGTIAYNPYEVLTGVVRAGKRRKIVSEKFSQQLLTVPIMFTNNLYKYTGLVRDNKECHVRNVGDSGTHHVVDGIVPWNYTNDIRYDYVPAKTMVMKTTVEEITVSPLDSGVVQEFESGARSMLLDMDDVLITEALSKANDREIDLLTTLAELPKTVKSVISGLKLITKITRDAKKREFAIAQSQIRLKEDKMKLAYKKYLSKRRRGKRHKDSSFDKWKEKNETRFAVDSVTEVTDAISGVWMTYRYEIRPLVYTVQDAVSSFEKFDNQYITTRTVQTRQIDAPAIPGYTFIGSCSSTHRVWIKRRYDVSEAINKFNKVIMADVFVTAYELIPIWSIVADWFLTIGPALRALQFNTNYQSQAATYSVKTEIKGRYVLDSDPSEFNEVEFVGYKRTQIQPARHITIQYVNNFDHLKGYDSLAFFWGSIGRRRVNNIKYKEA